MTDESEPIRIRRGYIVSNRLKWTIFILVVGVLFFFAWTNRYEHIMGFAYHDRWFGGVVYADETSSVFKRLGDRLSQSFQRYQVKKRLEQERSQFKVDEQRLLISGRMEADTAVKELAERLTQENERNAEHFIQSYKAGQELDVERDAIENMMFYARLLKTDKDLFFVRDQRLKRSDVASRFAMWREKRKQLLEAELTRLSSARLLVEQKVAQATKNVLNQRELQDRGQYVAALARQGRYGNAEVRVLGNVSPDSERRVNEHKSTVDALRQREDVVRQRMALY